LAEDVKVYRVPLGLIAFSMGLILEAASLFFPWWRRFSGQGSIWSIFPYQSVTETPFHVVESLWSTIRPGLLTALRLPFTIMCLSLILSAAGLTLLSLGKRSRFIGTLYAAGGALSILSFAFFEVGVSHFLEDRGIALSGSFNSTRWGLALGSHLALAGGASSAVGGLLHLFKPEGLSLEIVVEREPGEEKDA